MKEQVIKYLRNKKKYLRYKLNSDYYADKIHILGLIVSFDEVLKYLKGVKK